MSEERKSVSELLVRWRAGDSAALDALIPFVYRELQNVARNYLRAERSDHTLRTTALVHEAYLRLVRDKSLQVQNRAHFFAVAAHVMRQILVEYARRRNAAKRQGGYKLSMEETIVPSRLRKEDLLALDDALNTLAKVDLQQSQIVELRFFAGLSIEETSQVLGISPATVKRDWATAKVWLHHKMTAVVRHNA